MFDDLIPATSAAPAGITFDDLIPQQPVPPVAPDVASLPRVVVRPESAAPPTSPGRSLRIGAQGVGAGIRDTVLMPFDLAAGAQNLVMGGVNKVFGTDIPMATPASQMAEQIAAPISIPESEMSSTDKLGYNVNRFGTQGLGMGAMLAGRALAQPIAAASAKPASDIGTRTLDTMTRPYSVSPANTAAGDAISGMGAGAAVNAAQDYLPKEPITTSGQIVKSLADVLAPLLGGVAATTAQGATQGIGGAIRNMANNRRTDVNIPVSETGKPYTRADSERAAADLQGRATGPAGKLARDIRENADEFTNPTRPGETPLEQSQLPTTGLLSRDPGLVTSETGARVKNQGEFVQRDQNVKEAAAQRVNSVRDPDADQDAVGKFMQDEPKRLAAERDAEALPLLRQAEAAGAVVDTTAVARAIDEKLATAKRAPVRSALAEARKLLNKVGTDEADTSVSGLYEARKAINDIVDGRGENATGRFAKRELLEVRDELDAALTAASPEFGQYLQKYREGSAPVNAFEDSVPAQAVANAKNGDVRNVAKSIMSNGAYGGERQAEEIGRLIAQNPEAKDGWRAAVADVLSDKVTSSRKVGETPEVQYARLAKEFKDNEALLAKVYSPEEMNTLRQGHKLLGYFKEAEKRATVGSNTADKAAGIPQSLQLAARTLYGDLKGGGVIKRFKLMLELLPTNKQNADEIVQMAWFNPEVAAYLLEKKVQPKGGAQYSVNLRRIMGLANASRESGEN